MSHENPCPGRPGVPASKRHPWVRAYMWLMMRRRERRGCLSEREQLLRTRRRLEPRPPRRLVIYSFFSPFGSGGLGDLWWAQGIPPPGFSQVLILKVVKVLCFDTDLQVFILKGLRGAMNIVQLVGERRVQWAFASGGRSGFGGGSWWLGVGRRGVGR